MQQRLFLLACSLSLLVGCPSPNPSGPSDASPPPSDVAVHGDPALWCSYGDDVPGARLAAGFCLRSFAAVGSPRALQFTPDGDLLVSAPSTSSPGGSGGGPGAIVLLSDDDHNGVAESHTFATRVPDVHGITLGGGYLYFTTQSDVYRTPFAAGQRAETQSAREAFHLPGRWGSGGRWTRGLARSQGGTLYGSRAEYSTCGVSQGGEIYTVGTGGVMTMAVSGLRNPMYMRCHYRDELCLAAELGEDQQTGAREKLIRINQGNAYGFPCCFTTDLPATPACAAVTREDYSITLGDTPFGFDWERGTWPTTWRDGLFVALHGSFYTGPWLAAGIVYLPTDPATHMPTGQRRYILEGFSPDAPMLRRPADVAFAPDGRMFFADDLGNRVYWIAPTTLRLPGR